MDASGRPDRTLLIVLAAVAALVVVALLVVFTRGAPTPIDASTPAGVVQRYTAALLAGDEETARGYLVDDGECERLESGPLDDVRVTLLSTTERERSADVDVSIVTTSGGGLLGPSEYREDATFGLVRADSGWQVETAPWQFAICMHVTP